MTRHRSRGRDVDGIVLLDKPVGLSSNDALQRAKRLFMARKAGHTGSLDRLASGLLPICLGEATKISGVLLNADKHYLATFRLGRRTTTGDAEGEVVEERPVEGITRREVEQALARFLGAIDQVPPMHSASSTRASRSTSWPTAASRWSARRGAWSSMPSTSSRSTGATSRSRSGARKGPTCARWRKTSARCWGAGRTSPPCVESGPDPIRIRRWSRSMSSRRSPRTAWPRSTPGSCRSNRPFVTGPTSDCRRTWPTTCDRGRPCWCLGTDQGWVRLYGGRRPILRGRRGARRRPDSARRLFHPQG